MLHFVIVLYDVIFKFLGGEGNLIAPHLYKNPIYVCIDSGYHLNTVCVFGVPVLWL